MKLSEIVQLCFLRSGQYIIGELDALDLNMAQFWRVMQQELFEYQRHFWVTKQFNIGPLDQSGAYNGIVYDFSTDEHNVGFKKSDVLGEPPKSFGWPPRKIQQAVPVGKGQMITNWLQWQRGRTATGTTQYPYRIPSNRMKLERYRAPLAYFTEPGTFDVTCHYDFFYEEITDARGVLTDVNIPDLETKATVFINMCCARFLQQVGGLHSAFIHNDLDITVDGPAMIARGDALYIEAIKQLQDRSQWYKAGHV